MEIGLQLTNDEKSVLENVYGRQLKGVSYNPRGLEAIKDLSAQEKKFFAGKNFVATHFFIHKLYKVQGLISPIKFHSTVNRMIATNENLRVNFCDLGTRTVKVIRPATFIKSEIIFRNLVRIKRDVLDEELRKIFEADGRRKIDLKHDPLINFAVYKTNEREFAILVTMAQIISENFDAEKFFSDLSDIHVEIKPKKNSDDSTPKNPEAIREYWARIFEKVPPPSTLPYEQKEAGAYRQRSFRTTIPADILSDLRGHAQSNRPMLMAILQSAWGFMLQLNNKRRDCLFCQISSSENSSLNVIPVRLIGEDNLTVGQIVSKQFRQLIVSQSYGLSDWTLLDELTVLENLFNHFLCFKEFTLNESNAMNYTETPAAPFGKIVYQDSWNVQDMSLGLYFRHTEKDLFVNFIYDAGKFSEGGVEKLYEFYLLILRQMLVDWNEKFSEFTNHLTKRVEVQPKEETISPEDERKKLRSFLSQIPVLQGRFEGTIEMFENQATIATYYEGDRLSSEMLKENFIFVADGILARNADMGDGWYNTLDIVEKNSFVNPTSLLEEQMFTLSATVLTEQAELLLIPHDVFIEILRRNSEVTLSVLNYAIQQMERYQAVWLQY